MKYVFKNIINFIKNEKCVFVLYQVVALFSGIMVIFAFGMYHHILQKKLNEQYGIDSIYISSVSEYREKVNKGNVLKTLINIEPELIDKCIIYANIQFPDDVSDDELADNMVMSTAFCVKNGKITVADIEESLRESNTLVEGNYFSVEQVENGELVCLSCPEFVTWYGNDAQTEIINRYKETENGTYIINGKSYTSIGSYKGISCIPIVPITSITDDCYVRGLEFVFDEYITESEYENIYNVFSNEFGDYIEFPNIEFYTSDNLKFYNTLIIICILIGAMAGITLVMLYGYILIQRRRILKIYRICGMTLRKVNMCYMLECVFLSIVSYIVAVIVFNRFLLPFIQNTYTYIGTSYTWKSYIEIGVIYNAVILMFIYYAIKVKLKNLLEI